MLKNLFLKIRVILINMIFVVEAGEREPDEGGGEGVREDHLRAHSRQQAGEDKTRGKDDQTRGKDDKTRGKTTSTGTATYISAECHMDFLYIF